MNSAESMSLRARINNCAKAKGVSPQLALQSFFAERFLARIERSPYAGNLALKGGTLMCAILGVAQRTTMDIDATIVGMRVDETDIAKLVEKIAKTDAEDGVTFSLAPAPPDGIAKDDEYGGCSVGLIAEFGTIRMPIGVDVTFGDIITPKAEFREFRSILDEGAAIRLLAYTTETLMAEKLQSILKRGAGTTRPRDFYDLHMLRVRGEYDLAVLAKAVANTFANRRSEEHFLKSAEIVESISKSDFQRAQWTRYGKKAPYAAGIAFEDVLGSLAVLLDQLRGIVEF